ncbi:hypothetical protein I316_06483 [Kwoniella heveanensis BCC8398]|uniref:Nucleic acid-binding protein n=1 Tax=Kwoniella heveanensis BCC8398 TaxID=1296120 RepID=A0A1B9GLM2_9TREE|nr:hypothetical protein I316_06483 [Kwoniella heveanensis BCC8398]
MYRALQIPSQVRAVRAAASFTTSSRRLDVSKVILVGRVGSDPILRKTSSGKPYYTYNVATAVGQPTEGEDGKSQQPPTSWHTIFSFNEFQHPQIQRLGKGSSVYVEADLEMRPCTSPEDGTRLHDRAFLRHHKLSVIRGVKPLLEADTDEGPDVE